MKSLDKIKNPINKSIWYKAIPIPKLKLPYDEWITVRLLGGYLDIGNHWLQHKKRYELCRQINFELPCQHCADEVYVSKRTLMHCIDRQDNQLKWAEIPETAFGTIHALYKLNVHNGTPYHINHPDFGCDVAIKKTSSTPVTYSAQMLRNTPLTDAEKALELYDFDEIIRGTL